MNAQEQINELNSMVKVKLAPSHIHGVGIIAIRDIRKGEKVYCEPSKHLKLYSVPYGSLKKLFPEIRELIMQRWAGIINGSMFQSPNDDQWLVLFMNHSDNPNYNKLTDTALQDIKKGEEITSNYCVMDNADKAFPDLCGQQTK